MGKFKNGTYTPATKEHKLNNIEKARNTFEKLNIKNVQTDNWYFRLANYHFRASTGLFIHVETNKRGRGIKNLLEKIK